MGSKYFNDYSRRGKESKSKTKKNVIKIILLYLVTGKVDNKTVIQSLLDFKRRKKIDEELLQDILLQLDLGEITKAELIVIRNNYKSRDKVVANTITYVLDVLNTSTRR
jgi:hypothetical protein